MMPVKVPVGFRGPYPIQRSKPLRFKQLHPPPASPVTHCRLLPVRHGYSEPRLPEFTPFCRCSFLPDPEELPLTIRNVRTMRCQDAVRPASLTPLQRRKSASSPSPVSDDAAAPASVYKSLTAPFPFFYWLGILIDVGSPFAPGKASPTAERRVGGFHATTNIQFRCSLAHSAGDGADLHVLGSLELV